ncbi:MAG: hypothetical protein AOA65_0839 [Candidatus Bathyarchaeota archaeon BA1]|nr:MAG: hypothetical protein AOA65_0839 [Candidatus Bathyarchaeota archaeon BA1]
METYTCETFRIGNKINRVMEAVMRPDELYIDLTGATHP